MIVCWPEIRLGDEKFHLSTQLAGLMGYNWTGLSGDIPYRSPSNNRLYMDSAVVGDKEISLGLEQANYLNGQGVVTALNFIGGWKAWGNRTACYPQCDRSQGCFHPDQQVLQLAFQYLYHHLFSETGLAHHAASDPDNHRQ